MTTALIIGLALVVCFLSMRQFAARAEIEELQGRVASLKRQLARESRR
jgi:hypothetical protein